MIKILKIIVTVAVIAAIVVLSVILTPKIMKLRDPVVRDAVRDKIEALGAGGVVAVFFLQIAQVVLAFLPGEPVEHLIGFI